MIQFSGVTKRYPTGYEALRDVSFEVAAGELVVVTGHSGAGKSTLLKLAAGIERATRGSVVVNGQNLSSLGETALAVLRRHIGFVFQDHKLLFDRSAGENVALPLRIAGTASDETGRRVRAALDKVGLLAREKALPITLSGGEQQRLCIARAIVNRPAILVADEPTGNLDAESSRAILELFLSFHRVGVTVLLSTHDVSSLSQLGGRHLALRAGLVESAAPLGEAVPG
ncbi:MAG: ATP-binding cassette domain-containing protein [Betaproteobacteria bacterium]|nr:ATP-binding cassette domain-containing protein [Betaproteobacteria bacterium]